MPSGLQQPAQLVGMNVFSSFQLLSLSISPSCVVATAATAAATNAANNQAQRRRPGDHLKLTAASALPKPFPARPLLLLWLLLPLQVLSWAWALHES
jgi:hypothetical protein